MTIDITRPHIGRIYDYVLGGTYNYEADRIAAREIIARMPSYPRWARLNRWFLSHVLWRRPWTDPFRAPAWIHLGDGDAAGS